MPGLDTIQARVRLRLEALGISANEASRKAGRGTSYVNDLLAGHSRNPKLEHLSLLAEVLECDVAYLLGDQDTLRKGEVLDMPVREAHSDDPRSVPWFSVSLTDADGFFEMKEADAAAVSLPLEGVPRVYAVSVVDASMSPRYMIGEVVFVNPRRPVGPGAFVVIRFNDDRALIRQVVEISGTSVVLKALATNETATFDRASVKSVHRITAVVED
jgi:SOS-response transcriptional repressor LexA